MHRESQEINDPVWDCTLIKLMKEKGDTLVNPIYHWREVDIWDYIRLEHIKTNPLYECGYRRVGCIGCPLANYKMRIKEFTDYPKYKGMYIRAFDKMLTARREKNMKGEWKNGIEVFNWWIEEYRYNLKGQISIDEYLQTKEGI